MLKNAIYYYLKNNQLGRYIICKLCTTTVNVDGKK